MLVVGGGAAGAAAAREAALSGYRTALIERQDFGGGTSAHCFKVVHGGIRYIQHRDVRRLRASCRERSVLLKLAPHLVKPLPFVIPTYGSAQNSKWFLGAGMLLYDALSADRNLRQPDRKRQRPLDALPQPRRNARDVSGSAPRAPHRRGRVRRRPDAQPAAPRAGVRRRPRSGSAPTSRIMSKPRRLLIARPARVRRAARATRSPASGSTFAPASSSTPPGPWAEGLLKGASPTVAADARHLLARCLLRHLPRAAGRCRWRCRARRETPMPCWRAAAAICSSCPGATRRSSASGTPSCGGILTRSA